MRTIDARSGLQRAFLMSLLFVFTAYAQTSTATLTGIVRDQSGAVIPGVTVTVTDSGRGTSLSTISNESGSYVIPVLNPGTYSMGATLPGFKRFQNEGIVLQIAQVARVDIALEVGQVDQFVQVTAAPPLLETETSSRGSVIDRTKIVELPLNGRDYNQLAQLSPGVLPATPRLSSVNFKGAMNVNGNRVFSNVFLLDGVDNVSYSNSFRGENVQLVQPSVDALQEFKIQTNGYSAEYGRSSGAVINATLKSGSNRIRGTVYEFLRNNVLDANNYFLNAAGEPRPVRKRNQFGAAVGGPIVKNRTFWFADYEGLREREGVPRTRVVPTADEKAGRFDVAVFDPFMSGRPEFGRNAAGQWVIPENQWDPVGANIIRLLPNPNVPGTNRYVSSPITRTRSDQFDVKIDDHLSDSLQIFGRYSFVDTSLFRPGPLPDLAEGSNNDAFGASDNRSQGLAIGLTWTASPSLVGDFRFGWGSGNYFTTPPNFGIDGPGQVGLTNVPNDPSIVGGLPKMNLQGFDAIGRHTSTPQFQTPRSWNPRAAFSLHSRNHFIKFGAEYLRLSTEISDLNAVIGRMNFDNRFTGRAVGDLLLGLPTQLALTSLTVMDQSQWMTFFFIQDDYKITPKLTLNMGLRYEFATPPLEKENRFINFDPTTGTDIAAKDGSIYERALIHPDLNNFAPRFGFSYTPAPGWAIRGAYGVFYNHAVRQGREGLLGFNPPYLVDNLLQTSVSGSAAVASAAVFHLSDGYPQGLLDPNSLSPTVMRRAQDAFQRTPYVQQYNLSVQRELTHDLLLDVAYVGNRGVKLPGFRNLNSRAVIDNLNGTQSAGAKPYLTYGDIQWMENRVTSDYNSLQVSLEKRLSRGFSALVSYTWGKALSDAPDHISSTGGGVGIDTGVSKSPQNPDRLKAERGPAEFDVQHRLSVSYVYELPFGRGRTWGQNWSGVTEVILGGWQLTGIHALQTGLALTPTLSGSSVLNLGSERQARPNVIGDPVLPKSERTTNRWFNTDAFTAFTPAPQAFGSSGVGVVRGPGFINFDFNLAKSFALGESRSLQFRTEVFNAFNHANFNPPDIRRDATTFGQILSAQNGRIIQFGLKLNF